MQNPTVAQSRVRSFIYFLWLLACVSAASLTNWAQNNTAPDRGFRPAGSYALGDIESVNNYSGNLALHIPMASLPAGRGGHPGASVGLSYNSKLYETYTQKGPSYPFDPLTYLQGDPDGGWQWDFSYQIKQERFYDDMEPSLQPTCPSQDAIYNNKVSIVFPDGSEHLMKALGHNNGYDRIRPNGWVQNCSYPNYGYWTYDTVTYYSTDGTHLRMDVLHDNQNLGYNVFLLYFPDGRRITFNETNLGYQRFYDRNNNYVELRPITWNGQPAHQLIDQLNRSLIVQYDSVTGNTNVFEDGVGGVQLQWVVKWTYSNVYKTYYPDGNNSVATNYYASFYSVQEINLPTQAGSLKYTFAYNGNSVYPTHSTGYGELSALTLPSGASTTYQYAKDNIENIETSIILTNNVTTKTLSYRAEYDGLTGTSAPLVNEQWVYNPGSDDFVATVTNPDGGVSTEYFSAGYPYSKPYKTVAPDGSVVERIWQENLPYGDPGSGVYGSNPYVKTEYRSIKDGNGTLSKTAIKDFTYDKNGNVTQTVEYDWVAYSSVTRGGTYNLPTGIPGSAVVKRVNVNTYYSPTPEASNSSYDADTYNQPTSPRLKNALESSEVRSSTSTAGVLSRTENFYDSTTTTGNLIQQKSWDSTKGVISYPLGLSNLVSISNQYDSFGYGNLKLATDALGNQTEYTYDANNLYVVETKVAKGTTVQRTTTNQYDFYTGLETQETDVDNNITDKTTYDVFGRPTLMQEAFGTGVERRTSTEYSDTARRVITRADLNTTNDGKLVSIEHYDQLGRLRLSRSLDDATTQDPYNETHGTKKQYRQAFSGSNSYGLASAPYAANYSYNAGGEAGMGWKRTKYDSGGKAIEDETFVGATLPAPWGANTSSSGKQTTQYDANYTTVTEQANKKRRSEIDGLGRLTRVDEPDASNNLGSTASPIQATSYSYNANGNLTQINQGVQTRTFNYTSLSRLNSATSPESGTIAYQYDNGGNLTQKTDARGISVAYTYDALNRNKTVDYSNTAVNPDITRNYDGATNGKGKAWEDYAGGDFTNGQTVEYKKVDGYDALGRPLSLTRRFKTAGTWGSLYTTSSTYNLAGNVNTLTYPSGRTVNYGYDAEGKLNNFNGNLGGTSRTYASGILYNPQGQMLREQYGTSAPLYHNRHYNARGQLYDVRLGTGSDQGVEWTWNRGAIRTFYDSNFAYGNGWTNNNNNVYRVDHFVPENEAASQWSMSLHYFGYDTLNRITGVWENKAAWNLGEASTGLTQQYVYDRYGNRTVNNGASNYLGIFNQPLNVDPTTNRLFAPNGCLQYDTAGNLINDCYIGAGARTYDAENRMLTATQNGGGTANYSYDADGNRVRRTISSTTTWQMYGLGGELIAEYAANAAPGSPQKEYAYRNGQLLIVAESTKCQWLVADALGTPRMIADQTGSLTGMRRHDYLPFGEEITAGTGLRTTTQGYPPVTPADAVRQQFTGKERDTETSLDYFLARYYSANLGRFTSPDEFTGGPDELYDFAIDASDNPTFYADLHEPQSLNKYTYCYNSPLVYTDEDGHQGIKDRLKEAASATVDLVGGYARGVASSLTFGYVGAPSSDDSGYSRLGQTIGTVHVGVQGGTIAGTGGATIIGTGGAAALTGVPVAAVVGGGAMVAGSAKNLQAMANTPMARQPHKAEVRVSENGNTVSKSREVSGQMTPEQKKMGYPKGQLASHTEAKAVKNNPLKSGQKMTITGTKRPCPSCKGKMNKAAKESGGEIQYRWRSEGRTQTWEANKKRGRAGEE
jgi:RHS repeat-associated protein